MLSLVIGILLGRYVTPTPIIDFLEGLFYGLSVVMNILYFILEFLQNKISKHFVV
jgi:hypothetical protein